MLQLDEKYVMYYTKLKANLSGREKCDLKSSKFLKIKDLGTFRVYRDILLM